jgi:hypothetical protein
VSYSNLFSIKKGSSIEHNNYVSFVEIFKHDINIEKITLKYKKKLFLENKTVQVSFKFSKINEIQVLIIYVIPFLNNHFFFKFIYNTSNNSYA